MAESTNLALLLRIATRNAWRRRPYLIRFRQPAYHIIESLGERVVLRANSTGSPSLRPLCGMVDE